MILLHYDANTGDALGAFDKETSSALCPEPKIEITEEQWLSARGMTPHVTDGVFAPVPKARTQEDIIADYDNAMEEHLLAERTARGYTLREPSDYAGSSVARFAADAADWIAHRDAVMLYALDIQNSVAAGQPVPTLDDFASALPVITWTAQ